MPHPRTKIHQVHYAEFPRAQAAAIELLALSTEDGRILFYSTTKAVEGDEDDGQTSSTKSQVPTLQAVGQLGGSSQDQAGRIKDFEILHLPHAQASSGTSIVVSGSSDGWIRIWKLSKEMLCTPEAKTYHPKNERSSESNGIGRVGEEEHPMSSIPVVGELVGSYGTGSRITCLKAFVQIPSRVGRELKQS